LWWPPQIRRSSALIPSVALLTHRCSRTQGFDTIPGVTPWIRNHEPCSEEGGERIRSGCV
jgi:hypothetical protein